MFKIIIKIVCLFFFSLATAYTQGEAAVPFLLINPSPNLNGMAGAFTALPTDDAFGAYHNPAQLGYFAQQRNIAYHFYSSKTDWLPRFNFSGLYSTSQAVALGYYLKKNRLGIPISIGLSYLPTKLNLGENVHTDAEGNILGTFNSYEKSNAISLGIGFNTVVDIYLGLSYKSYLSNLGPAIFNAYNYSDAKAKGSAMDYGLLLVAPLADYIDLNPDNSFMENTFINLSLGYALCNIGKEVTYSVVSISDPLPRQGRLGYGVSMGFGTLFEQTTINVFTGEWSSEARDMYIKRNGVDFSYQSFPGDINLWENFILGNSDDKVQVNAGWRVIFLESFQYAQGKFSGYGYEPFVKTRGIGFTSRGLFQLMAGRHKNKSINLITQHLEIAYFQSKYMAPESPITETEYRGIEVVIKDLEGFLHMK